MSALWLTVEMNAGAKGRCVRIVSVNFRPQTCNTSCIELSYQETHSKARPNVEEEVVFFGLSFIIPGRSQQSFLPAFIPLLPDYVNPLNRTFGPSASIQQARVEVQITAL